jgi:hypothetical protein
MTSDARRSSTSPREQRFTLRGRPVGVAVDDAPLAVLTPIDEVVPSSVELG